MIEKEYEVTERYKIGGLVNLTPHSITLRVKSREGDKDVTIPPSGQVLRVENREMARRSHVLISDEDHNIGSVTTRVLECGNVSCVPEKLNTIYIVSLPVLMALDTRGIERYDFVAPDTDKGAIRDEEGKITAVTGFVVFRDKLYVSPGEILKIHGYPEQGGPSLKEQARRKDTEQGEGIFC